MKNIMLDLETLGTPADSVFLSLAAVEFETSGEIGREFKINIALESAQSYGRKIYSSTLHWWLDQKPEVMKLMFNNPCELHYVLQMFREFYKECGATTIWSNGASFDIPMLAHAYRSNLRQEPPWAFYNERCYRTAFALSKLKHNPKPENAHDPLADCLYQIVELQRVFHE